MSRRSDGLSEPGDPIPTRRGEQSAAAFLNEQDIVRRRVITVSESADGNAFYLDDKQWDAGRDDAEAKVGDVRERTIRDVTGVYHVP